MVRRGLPLQMKRRTTRCVSLAVSKERLSPLKRRVNVVINAEGVEVTREGRVNMDKIGEERAGVEREAGHLRPCEARSQGRLD